METEELLHLYREIARIRYFETKLDYLFKRGLVHGTAHYCIGQEFIPVIISRYLTEGDSVTSTHRGHGHALARGLDTERFLAELMGKAEGYNSGKGGSQHVISEEFNFYANGITGGMVPVANGLAFSNKYMKKRDIVVAYLGDGGLNEGHVYESLNLSVVLGLPILFVCENNHYAMSTHINRSHSSEISRKVSGFGIKCGVVEDNDYKKLNELAPEFIGEVRESSSPGFLEIKTYRHLGHSKNDLNLYRDKEEEEFWFERDVFKLVGDELVSGRAVSGEELQAIVDGINKEIEAIAEKVIGLSCNDPEGLTQNVYSE
jgi:pyruvate dehydrogenase E1 component alpha subunit